MFNIPHLFKKISPIQWAYIVGVWTLAAFSLTTQFYFSTLPTNPGISWLRLFLQQIPFWYLCILLTPAVMVLYEVYPLDTPRWKQNLVRHVIAAVGILLIFSNLRLLCLSLLFNPNFAGITFQTYLSSFISQMAWDLAIYIFIVIVLFADKTNRVKKNKELYAAQVELQNQELQNQLNQAQLEALKLQLSPHFLFNTLHTIGSLIRTGEYDTAIHVNTRLGDFLRKTLTFENQHFVSLEQELAFVDLYLDIESIRFKDRLVVRKEIAPECLRVSVPYLILQPLVENAIKHGIAKYRSAKLVEIRTSVVDEYLTIDIYNDTAPLPEKWLMEENKRVGLKNVQERLEKIYPDASLRLYNDQTRNGVIATIQLPL